MLCWAVVNRDDIPAERSLSPRPGDHEKESDDRPRDIYQRRIRCGPGISPDVSHACLSISLRLHLGKDRAVWLGRYCRRVFCVTEWRENPADDHRHCAWRSGNKLVVCNDWICPERPRCATVPVSLCNVATGLHSSAYGNNEPPSAF